LDVFDYVLERFEVAVGGVVMNISNRDYFYLFGFRYELP
jgi:hypothetical protein